jgi:hypothetical protein
MPDMLHLCSEGRQFSNQGLRIIRHNYSPSGMQDRKSSISASP